MLRDRLEVIPDEKFQKVISGYLDAYIHKGEKPPEDIAVSIMNMADDYLAGKPLDMRAGDYIAFYNHIRNL